MKRNAIKKTFHLNQKIKEMTITSKNKNLLRFFFSKKSKKKGTKKKPKPWTLKVALGPSAVLLVKTLSNLHFECFLILQDTLGGNFYIFADSDEFST